MKTKKNRTAKLGTGMQALEDRRLMAVDVTMSGGDLVITGNGASDQIEIYRVSANHSSTQQVRISPIAGSGTTINGNSYAQQFTLSDDIWLDLGNGNNTVVMKNNNGGIHADYVRLRTGSGSDRIDVNGLNTTSDLLIETRAGNDDVAVTNSYIGNGAYDDLLVRTAGGEDAVEIENTRVRQDINVQTYDNVYADEDDSVFLSHAFASDDIWVKTGHGDDDVDILDSHVNDDIDVQTHDGADTIFLNRNTVDNDLRVNAGAGNDRLYAYRTTVKDDATLNGGSGTNDRLYTYDFDVEDDQNESGWESTLRF